MKVSLHKKLSLQTDKITTEKAHRIVRRKKKKYRRVNGRIMESLWEDQFYINKDFSEHTVEKKKILFKRAKEIRESGEFTKAGYNRLNSY